MKKEYITPDIKVIDCQPFVMNQYSVQGYEEQDQSNFDEGTEETANW